ncbi:MAG: DUF167 domain-containing protein [Burkholderiales bacterium]|nr:DUF167 domain-containing protein [Burkholderiales bacterium]
MQDFDDLPCLQPVTGAGACLLQVQVVPNAGRTGVAGLHDGALRVRLRALAIEGRANAELERWLVQALDLARRDVSLVAGTLARRKRVRLECQPQRVAAWLREQLAPDDTGG